MRKVGRHFLQIPGPSAVPVRILRAIGQQTIDHRGPDFAKVGLQSLSGIKSIFNTVETYLFTRRQGLALGKQPWSILFHRGTAF